MTFVQIVKSISEKTGMPKTKVSRILKSFFQQVESSVMSGEPVKLHGFGRFYPKQVKEQELFKGTRKSRERIVLKFRESRRGKICRST